MLLDGLGSSGYYVDDYDIYIYIYLGNPPVSNYRRLLETTIIIAVSLYFRRFIKLSLFGVSTLPTLVSPRPLHHLSLQIVSMGFGTTSNDEDTMGSNTSGIRSNDTTFVCCYCLVSCSTITYSPSSVGKVPF